MSYSSEVLADAPAVYYRLDETTGTTMNDSSGNARNGAYHDTYTLGVSGALVSDPTSTALSMPGTTAGAIISYGAWMNFSVLSIECWFKTTAGGMLVARDEAVGKPYYMLVAPSQGISVQWVVGTTGYSVQTGSAAAFCDNQWHHVVAKFGSGTTAAIYVDGVSRTVTGNGSAQTGAIDIGVASYALRIGRRGTQSPVQYNGSVDEVALYGTALSATRIQAHYNAGIAAPVGNIAATLALPIRGPSVAIAGSTAGPNVNATISAPIPGPSVSITAGVYEPDEGAVDLAIPGPNVSISGTVTTPSGSVSLPIPGPSVSVVIANDWADTDTSNLGHGRSRIGSGEDHTLYPVKPLPAHLTVTKHRIMAQQMPAPVLVDGKPT